MVRNLTDEELHELLVSRRTKGAAFMAGDYKALRAQVLTQTKQLSREELFKLYPEYLYDVAKTKPVN